MQRGPTPAKLVVNELDGREVRALGVAIKVTNAGDGPVGQGWVKDLDRLAVLACTQALQLLKSLAGAQP